MRSRSIIDDPVWLGFLTFTPTLLIQLFHESEHVMQMLEKYVWHWRTFPGLLGQWFDFEWIHFLYNGALWVALLATWIIYRNNPRIWRPSALAASALSFVVIFQGYHWFEHWTRMVQYYLGNPKPPGILGQVISVLELHFLFGTIVTIAMLLAYGGFQPWRHLSLPIFMPARLGEEQAESATQ